MVSCQNLQSFGYDAAAEPFKLKRIYPDTHVLFYGRGQPIDFIFTEPQKDFNIEYDCYGIKLINEGRIHNRYKAHKYNNCDITIDDPDIIDLD